MLLFLGADFPLSETFFATCAPPPRKQKCRDILLPYPALLIGAKWQLRLLRTKEAKGSSICALNRDQRCILRACLDSIKEESDGFRPEQQRF